MGKYSEQIMPRHMQLWKLAPKKAVRVDPQAQQQIERMQFHTSMPDGFENWSMASREE